MNTVTLAAGPIRKEPMSQPYRVVLLLWPNGQFSTHMESLMADDAHEAYFWGHYHQTADEAWKDWIEREAGRQATYPAGLDYLKLSKEKKDG